ARHDEAVEEARAALRDGPAESAPWVWFVHALAEAGRLGDVAEVAVPPAHREELTSLRAGYVALAAVSANDRKDAEGTVAAILDARHAPLYSLALRIAEGKRLAGPKRWPDLPSTWYAHECTMERKELRQLEHPTPPSAAGLAKAVRWL